jgi:hypothetical protein
MGGAPTLGHSIPAPFGTPHYQWLSIYPGSIMPRRRNPLYTSHRRPKQPQKLQTGPSNVPLNVTDLANADATTLTPVCFGHHGTPQSTPILVGEFLVTFLVTPNTSFGGLASNAHPMGVG